MFSPFSSSSTAWIELWHAAQTQRFQTDDNTLKIVSIHDTAKRLTVNGTGGFYPISRLVFSLFSWGQFACLYKELAPAVKPGSSANKSSGGWGEVCLSGRREGRLNR